MCRVSSLEIKKKFTILTLTAFILAMAVAHMKCDNYDVTEKMYDDGIATAIRIAIALTVY